MVDEKGSGVEVKLGNRGVRFTRTSEEKGGEVFPKMECLESKIIGEKEIRNFNLIKYKGTCTKNRK